MEACDRYDLTALPMKQSPQLMIWNEIGLNLDEKENLKLCTIPSCLGLESLTSNVAVVLWTALLRRNKCSILGPETGRKYHRFLWPLSIPPAKVVHCCFLWPCLPPNPSCAVIINKKQWNLCSWGHVYPGLPARSQSHHSHSYLISESIKLIIKAHTIMC